MRYTSGEPVDEGDHVLLDGDAAVVEEVIETPDEQANMGLDEPGVMLISEQLGRVFQSTGTGWDDLEVVRRGEES